MVVIKFKKLSVVLFSVLVIFIIQPVFLAGTSVQSETLQEELDRLEREIAAIQGKKDSLRSQIDNNTYLIGDYDTEASALYGEEQILQADIDQLELEIEELAVSLRLLNDEIKQKEQEIADKEANIVALEDESDSRIKSNYFNYRLYRADGIDTSNIFKAGDINEYFKDSQYKELIQADTTRLMSELAELKTELEETKAELLEKQENLDKEKEKIEIKRNDLAKQQAEVELRKDAYYNEIFALQAQNQQAEQNIQSFSETEARKFAEAERVRNQLFASFNPVGNGQFVVAGQYIGNQGCTGFCTGPHLHFIVWDGGNYQNPCGYIPFCGGSGLRNPVSGGLFTSGYGNRCFNWGGTPYCDFHNGVDIAASPTNAPIYAAHDGYAFKGVDPYGALYVIVCSDAACASGFKTGYWHLSAY